MTNWVMVAAGAFESACLTAGRALALMGATTTALGHVRRRRVEIVSQTFRASYGSLLVTFLTALFSGMILAFQTGLELLRFGQEASIGYIVAASMCREMGPVMTAIALAGLMGSSYAAELGTMKVSEEIDALEVMSIDPVRYLVMPRVVALVASSLALTVYVDAVGILGGAMVGASSFNVELSIYFRNAQDVLEMKEVWLGLIKAFFFAVSTATIGCTMGLSADQGAEGVGRATQKTVVFSFVFILMLDHLINYLTKVTGIYVGRGV
ncbi:MAG: ABC transporter permease [Planctomycetes bacterium]|nr:ABC transporter permease [Planctomycetota bacterium]